MSSNLPNLEFLLNVLEYDSDVGIFTWRYNKHRSNQWNSRYAYKEAGGFNSSGYRVINIQKTLYYAHRLAWFYHYKIVPSEIDHINGIPSDNRIVNLREVTSLQNKWNMKSKPGRSGVRGVHITKAGTFTALLKHNGKLLCFGTFPTLKQAAKAREEAVILYRKEFARHS